ncbi:hypothetical protein MOQ72_27065 [Saccharopolyspora sp. K220]|uniref:hypothetical protein n=1 Tax=Saccharopolyspora soli TaxID=2926618 RepID=UPI001F57B05A|nr:hypothetical protein [Saccharopolyspora soli]MCI2421109.1 hypothetical protein [Saccharopolyspora soli]
MRETDHVEVNPCKGSTAPESETAMSKSDTNEPKPKAKPIGETISTDRAWQIGRRIYVHCAYESKLGAQLREIGANWDREQRRLWVGSGKRDKVIPLVQAADARVQAVEDIKKQGRWVRVPYEATEIRAEVKKLDGVFDGDRKAWAMPDEASFTAIKDLLTQRQERIDAEQRAAEEKRQKQRQAEREAERAHAEAQRADRRERLLAESSRIPTGESAEHRVISTRVMNKAIAWSEALPLGKLVELDDGRRGIVVDRKVWFTGSEFASSVCWHAETHDEAHWDFAYTLALVEPTEQENADDAERATTLADAAALHQLVDEVARSDQGQLSGEFSTIPDQQRAGEIRCTYGTVGRHNGGRLILTTAGDLVYQHPGYYDDYQRTQRTLNGGDLVDRARALIERGPRTRVHIDQMYYDYEVIVTTPGAEPETSRDTAATDDSVGPADTSGADQVPEAASAAGRAALELVANALGAEKGLVARLATAVDHNKDTIEEFSDEDRFLSARRGVEVTLVRHDFMLPDGQVITLWAVDDAEWEVYEDADADSTTTVYLDEDEGRARWRGQVAEHQDNPPRAHHPEFDEDDEFSEDDDCPGLDVPHCDQCGTTTAAGGWMAASLGRACDIDCYDAMADAPGDHAIQHHRR